MMVIISVRTHLIAFQNEKLKKKTEIQAYKMIYCFKSILLLKSKKI